VKRLAASTKKDAAPECDDDEVPHSGNASQPEVKRSTASKRKTKEDAPPECDDDEMPHSGKTLVQLPIWCLK